MTVSYMYHPYTRSAGKASSSTSSLESTRFSAPAAQEPRATRRSTRLHPIPETKLRPAEAPKRRSTTSRRKRAEQPVASTSTIEPSPRALRLQKRRNSSEPRLLVTPPITALSTVVVDSKKRKRSVKSVEAQDATVVKKKRKDNPVPCFGRSSSKHAAEIKSSGHGGTTAAPQKIATRSSARIGQLLNRQPPTIVTNNCSPPTTPPSSPPLNPATYPLPLDIIDIGIANPAEKPIQRETTTGWNIPEPNSPTYPSETCPPLSFDTNILSAPETQTTEQQLLPESHQSQESYVQQQSPVPRKPSQPSLWVMACKMRVYEVEKYYPRNVIRTIVAQEADDYFSVHGLPPKCWRVWNPHHDDESGDGDQDQSFLQEEYYDFELTSDDEDDDISCPSRNRICVDEDEEDTDDDDDSDESIMTVDGDFNAELTSSLSEVSINKTVEPTSPSQTTSTLMTAFALSSPAPSVSENDWSTSFSDPSLPSQPFNLQTPPPMQSIPMPLFPLPLPRLSSVKVNLPLSFDVMEDDEAEEDDEDSAASQASSSSSVGSEQAPQTPLRRTPRKIRRNGMGKGTPIDRQRRAMWASSGSWATSWQSGTNSGSSSLPFNSGFNGAQSHRDNQSSPASFLKGVTEDDGRENARDKENWWDHRGLFDQDDEDEGDRYATGSLIEMKEAQRRKRAANGLSGGVSGLIPSGSTDGNQSHPLPNQIDLHGQLVSHDGISEPIETASSALGAFDPNGENWEAFLASLGPGMGGMENEAGLRSEQPNLHGSLPMDLDPTVTSGSTIPMQSSSGLQLDLDQHHHLHQSHHLSSVENRTCGNEANTFHSSELGDNLANHGAFPDNLNSSLGGMFNSGMAVMSMGFGLAGMGLAGMGSGFVGAMNAMGVINGGGTGPVSDADVGWYFPTSGPGMSNTPGFNPSQQSAGNMAHDSHLGDGTIGF